MKRTTASLLTGALAAGTFAVLATVTPGIASANCATDIPVSTADTKGWILGPNNTVGSTTTINEDSLVLTTLDQGRANAAYLTGGVKLATQTDQSNYAADLGSASYQLTMDLDGIPNNGIGFTSLVFEEVYDTGATAGTWYSTSSRGAGPDHPLIQTGGGHGSNAWATLANWAAEYPNATIDAFGLQQGSGVPAATAEIGTLRFGCNTFDFGNPPVQVPNTAPVAKLTVTDAADADYRTYFLDARAVGNESTDPDADALTYEIYVDGVLVTTNPNYLFTASGPGTYAVKLIVSDGTLTNEATDTITVAVPAPTTQGEPLPNTGANVIGLAVIGGLAVAGSGTGLVLRNRRRSTSAV